jgi:hypothetical protein
MKRLGVSTPMLRGCRRRNITSQQRHHEMQSTSYTAVIAARFRVSLAEEGTEVASVRKSSLSRNMTAVYNIKISAL